MIGDIVCITHTGTHAVKYPSRVCLLQIKEVLLFLKKSKSSVTETPRTGQQRKQSSVKNISYGLNKLFRPMSVLG